MVEEEKHVEFDSTLLYGAKPVFVRTVTGNVKCLRKDVWLSHSVKSESKTDVDTTEEEEKEEEIPSVLVSAIMRRLPQVSLGIEYSSLMLPSMPCLDITAVSEKPDGQELSKDPCLSLIRPWMKCAPHECTDESKSTYVRCFQSGVRSAIISLNIADKEEWFRLKGCGNNNDGVMFACISQKVGCDDGVSRKPLIEMRGVCFEHTVQRELHMNDRISQALKESPLGSYIRCANESIGYIEYTDTSLNKVNPTCGVFRTLGNRRLGSHVLYSMECLIPVLFDADEISDENMVSLYKLFPDLRVEMDENGNPVSVCSTHLAVACEMPVIPVTALKSLKLSDLSTDPSLLLNIDFSDDKTHHSEYINAFNSLVTTINDCSSDDGMFAGFADWRVYLCYRFGWESGFIQRVLRENGFVWGTYTDALGYHCNAHCNNVVITLPNGISVSQLLLAPLDFDMAFHSDEYLGHFRDKVKKVLNDSLSQAEENGAEWPRMFRDSADACGSNEFAVFLEVEMSGHRLCLSGDPEISSGVSGLNVEQSSTKHMLVSTILRDALVAGYNDALLAVKHSEMEQAWTQLTDTITANQLNVIRKFIQLCLVVSRKVIA